MGMLGKGMLGNKNERSKRAFLLEIVRLSNRRYALLGSI